MELGVTYERHGQDTDGSSECDSTSIHVNFTFTTEAIPFTHTRNTIKNDNIFFKKPKIEISLNNSEHMFKTIFLRL